MKELCIRRGSQDSVVLMDQSMNDPSIIPHVNVLLRTLNGKLACIVAAYVCDCSNYGTHQLQLKRDTRVLTTKCTHNFAASV